MHNRCKHNGITYSCDQCDISFTGKVNQTKQRRVTLQCTRDASMKDYSIPGINVIIVSGTGNLTKHSQYKHKGITYTCDKCELVSHAKVP